MFTAGRAVPADGSPAAVPRRPAAGSRRRPGCGCARWARRRSQHDSSGQNTCRCSCSRHVYSSMPSLCAAVSGAITISRGRSRAARSAISGVDDRRRRRSARTGRIGSTRLSGSTPDASQHSRVDGGLVADGGDRARRAGSGRVGDRRATAVRADGMRQRVTTGAGALRAPVGRRPLVAARRSVATGAGAARTTGLSRDAHHDARTIATRPPRRRERQRPAPTTRASAAVRSRVDARAPRIAGGIDVHHVPHGAVDRRRRACRFTHDAYPTACQLLLQHPPRFRDPPLHRADRIPSIAPIWS